MVTLCLCVRVRACVRACVRVLFFPSANRCSPSRNSFLRYAGRCLSALSARGRLCCFTQIMLVVCGSGHRPQVTKTCACGHPK